jgi:psiF repeat-containing protein
MKRSTWLVLGAALALFATQGVVAVEAASTNSQQEKMKSCNADAKAKSLTGDDRKAFMKTCLSDKGTAGAAGGNSQQQKMKSCNADAKTKNLTGDDRKAFMKSCLSSAAPAPAK